MLVWEGAHLSCQARGQEEGHRVQGCQLCAWLLEQRLGGDLHQRWQLFVLCLVAP